MDTLSAIGAPNFVSVGFFGLFVLSSLIVTWWAARRTKTAEDFFVAGRSITAGQNGMALAGDFVAAAGFLGIAGLVSLSGFDGVIYAVGGVLGWPIMMFLLAEPLRNLGRYTFTDVLSFRIDGRAIRVVAAANSLIIIVIYLIMQMVGAGTLIQLLFGLPYEAAVAIIGLIMFGYVSFGGMIATTWVQIIKAGLMIGAAILLVLLAIRRFDFNLFALFRAAADRVGQQVLAPGIAVSNPIEAISIELGLVFGVASLPHVLMRFYTVPDARTARTSLFYATTIIALFLLSTIVLGFAAMALVGPDVIRAADKGGNMAVPLLALELGGKPFLGFVAAVSFATILAVVSGLVITGAATLSHDLWAGVVRRDASSREQLVVARVATVLLCLLAIALGIVFKGQSIAYLVGLSTGVAASANFPVLVLAIFWSRLTKVGAIAGMLTGLLSSIVLIYLSPLVQVDIFKYAAPVIGLRNPCIVTMPLAFIVCITVSLATGSAEGRRRYAEAGQRLLLGETA